MPTLSDAVMCRQNDADCIDFKSGPIWNKRRQDVKTMRSVSGSVRCLFFGCWICSKTSTSTLIATRG